MTKQTKELTNNLTDELTKGDKINAIIDRVMRSGNMPLGNGWGTVNALGCVIENGDIDSDTYLHWQAAELLARIIYQDECYRTPLTDLDFKRIAMVASMIPINPDDENNDELVVSLILEAYVRGTNRVNALVNYLPEYMQDNETKDDFELYLDWVDTEINGGMDAVMPDLPDMISLVARQVQADEDYRNILNAQDIANMANILSRIPILPERTAVVSGEFVSWYYDHKDDYLFDNKEI